jgi:hypothetical protein
MTNHFHALVWLDHRIAKIFRFDGQSSESSTVHSTDPHVHLHHKANSGDSGNAPLDKGFLRNITAAMAGAGAILIAGPGSAKGELRTHVEHEHPEIAARISAVQTLDHPSDGELLAYGRDFFKADDRMRSQLA